MNESENVKSKKHIFAYAASPLQKKHSVETAYLKKGQHNLVDISERPKNGYKKIITEYNVISSGKKFALVKINLITGRTHQIRAHMAFLGAPILGDGKYGDISINKRTGIFRQQLCAYSLEFDFKSPGILDYLNGKVFQTDDTNFEINDKITHIIKQNCI